MAFCHTRLGRLAAGHCGPLPDYESSQFGCEMSTKLTWEKGF